MSSCRLVTVTCLRLFLAVPWVGLQCVIVVFPDHTHLHFVSAIKFNRMTEYVKRTVLESVDQHITIAF